MSIRSETNVNINVTGSRLLDLPTPCLFIVECDYETSPFGYIDKRGRVGLIYRVALKSETQTLITWFTDDHNKDGFEWDKAECVNDRLLVRPLTSDESVVLRNK